MYIKSGLYYSQLGSNNEYEYSDNFGNFANQTTTMSLNYIEIPLNIGYRYILSPKVGNIFAYLGPQLDIALHGNYKYNTDSTTHKSKIDFDFKYGFRPIDLGIKFGLGYEIPLGINLKINYKISVIEANKNVAYRNNALNVSLGYRIKF